MQPNPESIEQPTSVLANQVIAQENNGEPSLQEGETALMLDILPSPDEHYKIVIEDARALGDRRDAMNAMFVNIVSLIAGGAGYVLINEPGTVGGLAVVLAACAFGLRLCRIWQEAIDSYKPLLNFRYATLKIWETKYNFPSLRQYYTSEDLLYGALEIPTELSQELEKKGMSKPQNFVSLFVKLPSAAHAVFIALALLQTVAFVWRIASPFILPIIMKLPLPWYLLSPIKF